MEKVYITPLAVKFAFLPSTNPGIVRPVYSYFLNWYDCFVFVQTAEWSNYQPEITCAKQE